MHVIGSPHPRPFPLIRRQTRKKGFFFANGCKLNLLTSVELRGISACFDLRRETETITIADRAIVKMETTDFLRVIFKRDHSSLAEGVPSSPNMRHCFQPYFT